MQKKRSLCRPKGVTIIKDNINYRPVLICFPCVRDIKQSQEENRTIFNSFLVELSYCFLPHFVHQQPFINAICASRLDLPNEKRLSLSLSLGKLLLNQMSCTTLLDGYIISVDVKKRQEKRTRVSPSQVQFVWSYQIHLCSLFYLFLGSVRVPLGICLSYMSGVDRRIANFASLPC